MSGKGLSMEINKEIIVNDEPLMVVLKCNYQPQEGHPGNLKEPYIPESLSVYGWEYFDEGDREYFEESDVQAEIDDMIGNGLEKDLLDERDEI